MFDLQAEKMRAQLAALPPLCPPKLPQVSKDSSMPPEGLNTGIYRRTDQLLATLLKLSSEVKVVDVTGKTAGLCLCPHHRWCSHPHFTTQLLFAELYTHFTVFITHNFFTLISRTLSKSLYMYANPISLLTCNLYNASLVYPNFS